MDHPEHRLTIRLDGDLKERLCKLGEANGLPASWFVRRFVKDGLERWETGQEGIGKSAEVPDRQ